VSAIGVETLEICNGNAHGFSNCPFRSD
jgi:hypothetical protein